MRVYGMANSLIEKGEILKKLLIFVFLLFCLGGCCYFLNSFEMDEYTMKNIDIIEIDMCDIQWDLIQFPIDISKDALEKIQPIETKQTAIEVAKTTINRLHEKGRWLQYELIAIVHYTEDNLWRFEYSLEQENIKEDDLVDGSSLYIVLAGDEGKLVKAWIEE